MMLTGLGYEVCSLVGHDEVERCALAADLLVLAHSVPLQEKQRAIALFRTASKAPVLSLLRPHQQKLPEANYAAESHSPSDFLATVKSIL